MRNIAFLIFFLFTSQISGNSTLPTFDEIKNGYQASDVLYLDRDGNPMQAIRIRLDYRSESWVSLSDISPHLIRAVLFSEDKKFYEHRGVDSLAFAGSLWRRLLGYQLRGGSTITMQLVGMLDKELEGEHGRRSLAQKLKQIQRATELEEFWTKDEILTAYLNYVFFRGELRGIGAASKAFYGKKLIDLSPNESYLLSVLIRSPEASISKIIERGCMLKSQLEEEVTQSCDEFEIFAKQILFKKINYIATPNFAPQFINLFNKSIGVNHKSSISVALQKQTIQILKGNLKHLRSQNVDDGAVLILHNKTGEVLAYVANLGSDSGVAFMDLIQAKRQAGSTLKPFVYAQSFEERKLIPSSILNDAPIDLPVFRGIYRPLNYDKTYQGKVTVTQSLGSSLNIPAVRALSFLDIGKFLNTLSRLGFKGLAYPEFYGPSLALGTADISLWELTNSYRTLASGGVYSEPRLTIEELMLDEESNAMLGHRVFRESVAFLIQNILSDREARALSFGWESNLSTPFYTAVKTGTSQDMRDNWCIGFSSEYTVGVWVGNTKGSPMRDVSGVSGAGPVWREVMEYLHKDLASITPKVPETVSYDSVKRTYYEKGMEGIVDTDISKNKTKVPARITIPSEDTIFAFDPDIPYPHQKILFRLNVYNSKWKWVLNQKPLGEAGEPFFWDIEKGVFVLELRDEYGKEIDKVNFEVR
jgi:penicillin-binding protein 1C